MVWRDKEADLVLIRGSLGPYEQGREHREHRMHRMWGGHEGGEQGSMEPRKGGTYPPYVFIFYLEKEIETFTVKQSMQTCDLLHCIHNKFMKF